MDEKQRFKEIVSVLKESKLIEGITPQKVCETITKLGPTFIKIGQIMSSRVDIIPQEYCIELAKLRSDVEPMNFNEVKEILQEELGDIDEIFKEISPKSIGSASIAQVHKAILQTGEMVAIKVQRRNVYETMTLDIQLLKKAIKLLHLNKIVKMIDLIDVVDEIYNVAKEEMNFEIEAKHLEEFRENNIDIEYIDVPKAYMNLVTKKVLVMEFVEGIHLGKKEELIENGYDTEDLALKLSENYIKQALDDGFFHADPHQGNVCVRDGKIVFLDLGMMGRISVRVRKLLTDAAKAFVRNDIAEIERDLLAMSTVSETVNHTKLRTDIQTVIDKNATEDIQNIDVVEFINSVTKILRKHKIHLDKNITMLMRGICVIDGTLEDLAPDINLIMVLNNKLKKDSLKELLSKEHFINSGRNLVNGVNSMSELPVQLLNFVKDVNRGETKFDIELANSEKQVDKLEKMLHQLVIGLLDAAVLLGASFVENVVMKWIYGGLAGVFTVWLFVQMAKDHFHKGY